MVALVEGICLAVSIDLGGGTQESLSGLLQLNCLFGGCSLSYLVLGCCVREHSLPPMPQISEKSVLVVSSPWPYKLLSGALSEGGAFEALLVEESLGGLVPVEDPP